MGEGFHAEDLARDRGDRALNDFKLGFSFLENILMILLCRHRQGFLRFDLADREDVLRDLHFLIGIPRLP